MGKRGDVSHHCPCVRPPRVDGKAPPSCSGWSHHSFWFLTLIPSRVWTSSLCQTGITSFRQRTSPPWVPWGENNTRQSNIGLLIHTHTHAHTHTSGKTTWGGNKGPLQFCLNLPGLTAWVGQDPEVPVFWSYIILLHSYGRSSAKSLYSEKIKFEGLQGTCCRGGDSNEGWNNRPHLHLRILLRHCSRESNIPPGQCCKGVYISTAKNRACEVILGATEKKWNHFRVSWLLQSWVGFSFWFCFHCKTSQSPQYTSMYWETPRGII